MSEDQLKIIREHNLACANPLGTEADLHQVLKETWAKQGSSADKVQKVCASVFKDGKRHLLSYKGQTITTTDISGVEEEAFVNKASQEATFDQISVKLAHFRQTFIAGKVNSCEFKSFDPDQYQLKIANQGDQVCVPARADSMLAGILANMHPTYYDFNVCKGRDGIEDILHFNQKKKGKYIHSGDFMHNQILLHFVMLQKEEKSGRVALFISGYHNTKLSRFQDQSPANLLFDHEKKIIHVIEFPLDEASVGQSCLGIPGVGEFHNGYFYYQVFAKPETGSESAPNYSRSTFEKLYSAMDRFPGRQSQVVETSKQKKEQEEKMIIDTSRNEAKMEEAAKPHILELVVGKMDPLNEKGSHRIQCVGGVVCYLQGELDQRVHTEVPDDIGNIVLPGILGPIEGPFICLAAHPIKGEGVSPKHLEYFKNCFPIVTVTEMTDTARQTAGDFRINGFFIIKPSKPVNGVEQLAEVNKNAVTALAGPLSFVVVDVGEKYLFLEGCRLKGLVDTLPEFGAEFDVTIENLEKWALENCMEDPIVNITQCKPVLENKSYNLEEIILYVEKMSIDEIVTMRPQILDLFYQITRIYDDTELQAFGKKLFDLLDRKLTSNPHDAETLKELEAQFQSGTSKLKVSPLYEKRRGAYTIKKKAIRFLMDKVSGLISEKNSSSKAMTHKQLKRYNAIQGNMERVKNMDRSEFEDMVERCCSELGVLIVSGETSALKQLLKSIASKKMVEDLLAMVNTKDLMAYHYLLEPSSRQEMVDPTTAACLLQITMGTGILRAEDNSLSLSMPESMETTLHRGALMFPLLDMFVNMKDPYTANWIHLCNDPDVASFRIILRNTLVKASLGRDMTPRVESESKDLSWGLSYAYLEIMHQLASRKSQPMTEEDFDDTLCQQMRCLFGLMVSQLASGQDPISLVWQLWREYQCRPNLPMHSWQWPIYLEMSRWMPYTGWNMEVFRKNFFRLITRALNSKVAYPMCEFLRDERKVEKLNKYGEEYLRKLKEFYYPAKKSLTYTVKNLLKTGEIPEKEMIENFESIFAGFPNESVKRGSVKQMLEHMELMRKYKSQYNEKSKLFLNSLCDMIIKKYEPKLKMLKFDLRVYCENSMSLRKTPTKEQVDSFWSRFHALEAEKQEDKSHTAMEKILKLLTIWQESNKSINEQGIEKFEKHLNELFIGNKVASEWVPWKMIEQEYIKSINEGSSTIPQSQNENQLIPKNKNVMVLIMEHASNKGKKDWIQTIEKQNATKLSKLLTIDDPQTLLSMARIAGMGSTKEEIFTTLSLMLRDLCQQWEAEPDVLEKRMVAKYFDYHANKEDKLLEKDIAQMTLE